MLLMFPFPSYVRSIPKNGKNSPYVQLPIGEDATGFSAAKVLAAGLAVDKCYFFRVLSDWVDGMMRD